MNVPSNPIRAQEIADELYQIRQILERSKELFLSKKTAKEFQSDLSSRLNSLEHLNKNSDIYYNNVISKSPTAQKIWDME
jgi:chaperonin cofactor prefoldin